MNSRPFNRLFPLVLCLLIACEKDHSLDAEIQALLDADQEFFQNDLSETEVIVIIPRSGCSSCIGIADHFFKQFANTESKVKFVFTRISSVRTLKIRLGGQHIERENVLIDLEGKYAQKELDTLYPTLISLEGGIVTEVKYITDQTKEEVTELFRKLALTDNHKSISNKF